MDQIVLMGDPRVSAIQVRECGDDLIDALALPDLTFISVDENPQPSRAYSFLRRALVRRLQEAQRSLPDGRRLLLSEGYRPYELQDFYFTRYRRRLLDADPTVSADEASVAASQFVSPPEVAPHVSGAAIDLTLADGEGVQVDMGTPIDTSPLDSQGACYFAAENISPEARHNRTVLAAALTSAGLVNYPTEWWHWSYGDRYWALTTGAAHAIFGPLPSPVAEPATWQTA